MRKGNEAAEGDVKLSPSGSAAWAARFRNVDVAVIAPVASGRIGAPPKLMWLPLKSLVVDDAYQRPLVGAGIRNIRKIAETFDWRAFGAVVVARCGVPHKYAIVDGQHRCHAALLIALEQVPCLVIDADSAEQARTFDRVNAAVTRVHPLARFHALALAGDERAGEAMAMARAAGVAIMRYPQEAKHMPRAATLVSFDLLDLAKSFGRANLVLAMQAIASGGSATSICVFNRGLLNRALMGGLAQAFAARAHWGEPALLAAFNSFDLGHVGSRAAGGQHSRLNACGAELGRRMDSWARAHPQALRGAAAGVPQAGAAGDRADGDRSAGNVSISRKGVSLARVKGLEG